VSGRPIGAGISLVPRFTARRVALGLSTRAVAARLTEAGLETTQQAISAWESGASTPTVDRIAALARILRSTEDAVEEMFYQPRRKDAVESIPAGAHHAR
jgi:transcriptional regulator with XRE-family HTH domain